MTRRGIDRQGRGGGRGGDQGVVASVLARPWAEQPAGVVAAAPARGALPLRPRRPRPRQRLAAAEAAEEGLALVDAAQAEAAALRTLPVCEPPSPGRRQQRRLLHPRSCSL